MNYEELIDQLIEQKLKAALAALEKQRTAEKEGYAQKRQAAALEGEKLIRGAYGDYRNAADPTGVNAEALAAKGLSKSGKSETAKVGYFNVYQNALAAIRDKTDEQLAALSEQERKALAALDEADTKARDNAYTLLLEEQVRRQEQEREQAQADREYELELKKLESKSTAKATSSQTAKTEETALEKALGYPTQGNATTKYKWLKTQLEFLVNNVSPDEDNPRPRIIESAKKYLELAKRDLSVDKYYELMELVW